MLRVIAVCLLTCVPSARGLAVGSSGRRRAMSHGTAAAAAAAAAVLLPPLPALAKMSNNEMLALEDASHATYESGGGVLLKSGVRVIDVKIGEGPLPGKGDRIYSHFKLWTAGFDKGVPADASYWDVRPVVWFLGDPASSTDRGPYERPRDTPRIPVGVDEGVAGMREGGWRRLVVPASLAYGSAGLPFGDRGRYAVRPDTDVFVDLRLMDGGSGRCDEILRGKDPMKNSLNCVRGAP